MLKINRIKRKCNTFLDSMNLKFSNPTLSIYPSPKIWRKLPKLYNMYIDWPSDCANFFIFIHKSYGSMDRHIYLIIEVWPLFIIFYGFYAFRLILL